MHNWRWEVFLEHPQGGGGATYLGWLLAGLQVTAKLSAGAWVIALLWGSVMGVFRTYPSKLLYGLSTAYVEVFRNIPLLVQFFIWYWVVPEFLPFGLGLRFKQLTPDVALFIASVLCLGFFTGARITEQVRAGIESLSKGQKAAGLAMGFTLPQTYRHVLLPMAFRIIVPPLSSEAVNLVKNSAVASTLGLLELAAQGRQLVDYTAQSYEAFIAVTALYVALNLLILLFMRWVEQKARVPGFMGGGGR